MISSFFWKKSFKYLSFQLVILSIPSYLKYCHGRRFAPDTTWWGYCAPYSPTRFSLRAKYRCSLRTLPVQCLRLSNDPKYNNLKQNSVTKQSKKRYQEIFIKRTKTKTKGMSRDLSSYSSLSFILFKGILASCYLKTFFW